MCVSLVSCGGNETEPTTAPTSEPTATPEPTAEPTATPEPTPEPTATAVPEPGTYDLLNMIIDEDIIFGDGWDIIDGMWTGPLQEPGNAEEGATIDGTPIYGHREISVIETSTGEVGAVVRLAIDGDAGIRWMGNRYGLGEIGLKPNTKYKATAVVYYTGSTLDGAYSCLGYAEGTEAPIYAAEIEAKAEWQTITLIFETDGNIDTPNIVCGPNYWAGHCNYDYDFMIESLTIFEVVEEAKEEVNDLLKFKANGASVEGDTWGVTDGKFCGPLQAPDRGTEGEAKKDGKAVDAGRTATTTTLSDGSTGTVIKHFLNADEGYRNSGNFYGISNVGLKGNTTYVLTVVLKVTGTVGEASTLCVGFAPTKSGLTGTDAITALTAVEAKDEWQTVTLEFTTPAEITDAAICVGPNSLIGEIYAGYTMMIENMTLVEKTAE